LAAQAADNLLIKFTARLWMQWVIERSSMLQRPHCNASGTPIEATILPTIKTSAPVLGSNAAKQTPMRQG
jgi:hypothetical protein